MEQTPQASNLSEQDRAVLDEIQRRLAAPETGHGDWWIDTEEDCLEAAEETAKREGIGPYITG